MKKEMFAACAFTFMLFAGPTLKAQSLVDLFIWRNSHWEFTTGVGLLGWQERSVFMGNESAISSSSSGFGNRRSLSFKPDYWVDFDFKNSIRLSEQWALVFGIGTGLLQYDVVMRDFAYNIQTNTHEQFQTTRERNNFNFMARTLLGMRYTQPINEHYTLAVKAYGGVQPNGLEKDYRLQIQGVVLFETPDIYLRSFAGAEVGLMKDGKGARLLIPHSSINYRYMHFFGGKDYLATHSLRGIHQIVFGWGLRQNPKADK